MKSIKELYDKNINIMKYIRDINNSKENNVDAILISYDLQAGSYIKGINDNKKKDYHINNKKVVMNGVDYTEKFTDYISEEISKFEYSTVLEAGVGEATTFAYLIPKLKNKAKEVNGGGYFKGYGFDIAPSRIMQGTNFLTENNIDDNNLFVADMFNIPFKNNAIDIVYTVHAIEPNTDSATLLIKELYRVANKYLILIEPSYELGNKETKANIDNNKYIKKLKNIVEDLNYKIIKYELNSIGHYTNQSAIMVIEKQTQENSNINIDYACPTCKSALIFHKSNYFCKECFLVYPVINELPILKYNSGILYSQYLDS